MSQDHSFGTLKNMIYDIDHSWVIGDHFRSQSKIFLPLKLHFYAPNSQYFFKKFQWWNNLALKIGGNIYWIRISKGNYVGLANIFPKNTFLISNGWFWWLSCDRPWSAIIYVHWQNHEPRSWSLGSKKIWATFAHDREWSPITIKSSHHWNAA